MANKRDLNPLRSSRYWIDLALVTLIVCSVAWFMRYEFDPSPYYYDEADYLYATSRGFVANWTDTPAFSTLELIRAGMDRGRNPGQRTGVSEWIRNSGDINSYRHWHGPLYYYLLLVTGAPAHDEQNARRTAIGVLTLGSVLTYLGVLWVLRKRIPALLAAAALGLDPPLLVTTEIAPHVFFGVISLAAMFCAARMLESGSRRFWYAALAIAGLAFCTMEIAFALIIAVLICGWLKRRSLQPDRPFAAWSSLAFLMPIVVLWPAGLFKLTFLKSYLAMAYLAIFRKGAWGDVTFMETWANRFAMSPVAWLLIAVAIILYFARGQSFAPRAALPFLLFGAVMLAAVLRVNAPGPRYTVPFIMPLLVFAGCVIGNAMDMLPRAGRAAALAGVSGLLVWEANVNTRRSSREPDRRPVELLQVVRRSGLEDKALLAFWLDIPTLHYYFPRAHARGYVDDSEIPADLTANHFDAVIGSHNPVEVHRVP